MEKVKKYTYYAATMTGLCGTIAGVYFFLSQMLFFVAYGLLTLMVTRLCAKGCIKTDPDLQRQCKERPGFRIGMFFVGPAVNLIIYFSIGNFLIAPLLFG